MLEVKWSFIIFLLSFQRAKLWIFQFLSWNFFIFLKFISQQSWNSVLSTKFSSISKSLKSRLLWNYLLGRFLLCVNQFLNSNFNYSIINLFLSQIFIVKIVNFFVCIIFTFLIIIFHFIIWRNLFLYSFNSF